MLQHRIGFWKHNFFLPLYILPLFLFPLFLRADVKWSLLVIFSKLRLITCNSIVVIGTERRKWKEKDWRKKVHKEIPWHKVTKPRRWQHNNKTNWKNVIQSYACLWKWQMIYTYCCTFVHTYILPKYYAHINRIVLKNWTFFRLCRVFRLMREFSLVFVQLQFHFWNVITWKWTLLFNWIALKLEMHLMSIHFVEHCTLHTPCGPLLNAWKTFNKFPNSKY